jgi:hypothetical protein
MKKIDQIACKKCATINPLYTSICENCGAFLRERIVNIDLFKTIGQLIENTSLAFKQILFAENKNFIIFITIFLAIKNLLLARFFSVPELGVEGVRISFIVSYLIMLDFTFILFGAFTAIQKLLFKQLNIEIRYKDIYTLNIYSFIPLILSLIFIFPVELVVLGGDIFSNNPNPFQIKPTVAYILGGFEVILFVWSIVLLTKSIIFITGKYILSIALANLFLIALIFLYFFSAKIIF